MSNTEAAARHAAERARLQQSAPVYTPSTPTAVRQAGIGAYQAQVRAQSKQGEKK